MNLIPTIITRIGIHGRVPGLLALFIALTVVPVSGQVDTPGSGMTGGWETGRFFLMSKDGDFLLNIGGRIQSRYQYQSRTGEEDLSSFYLRRIRLDLQGHLFHKDLTFRIMPEMARTANLRDGWINYSFGRGLNVKAGQFSVPFHRQRFISGNRQFFAERSLPSEQFGFPSGYDVGVGVHGRNNENTFAYGTGIFDGAGRNVQHSNSRGNMASVRVAKALTGTLPNDETAYSHPEKVQLTLGAGVQGATRNEVRAWDLDRSVAGNSRADWLAGTTDLMLRWKGLSVAVDGYLRQIYPDDPAVDSYTGWATMLSAGYFVIPQRLEIIGRFSELRNDTSDSDTQTTVWDTGLNIYHRAHHFKTQINYSRVDGIIGQEDIFLVQLHLMF